MHFEGTFEYIPGLVPLSFASRARCGVAAAWNGHISTRRLCGQVALRMAQTRLNRRLYSVGGSPGKTYAFGSFAHFYRAEPLKASGLLGEAPKSVGFTGRSPEKRRFYRVYAILKAICPHKRRVEM